MKMKLAMVIDSSACIDCKACTVACKVENGVPTGYWRNWVKQGTHNFYDRKSKRISTRMHFQPGNCMHCSNATCVQACPTGATFKDAQNGVVKINKALCIGCGSCIPACPYGARYRHPDKKKVDKCDFCEDRRAAGLLPACVITCPTKARAFGNIEDPQSDVARLAKKNKTVQVIHPETDTDPNIYYLSATFPVNWPVKAKLPPAIDLWKRINPIVWGLVGLNALGVLIMLAKQVALPDTEFETQNQDGVI